MRRLIRISTALVILAVVAVSIFFIPACNPIRNVGDPRKPLPSYHPDRPFLFIHSISGYTRDPLPSGVVIAIYPDGRIIRATSQSAVGQSYLRGHLSPDDLARARRILKDSGLLSSKPGGFLVMHAASDHVGVRYGNRVTSWAHTPGLENTNNSSATNPRITRLKQELLALPVQDAKPEPPEEWARSPTEFYEGVHVQE
jgi:hypothetical protein